MSNEQIQLLNKIPFNHYRVELYLYESAWKNILSIAATEAKPLQTKLELIAFFDNEYDNALNEFITQLQPVKIFVCSILLLDRKYKTTPQELLQTGYNILKQHFPFINIGYGTDAYFAELNRNLPQQVPYDFVSFSLNPQVHASDTRSLMENLECQSDTIKTLKACIGNKMIHVSPVTLKSRKNHDDISNDINAKTIADARQHTFFTAFWTLISIQNLSEANQITFYELIDNAGIICDNKPSPVYEVLKMIKEFGASWIIKKYAGEELLMDMFCVENEKGERVVIKCGIV